MKEAKKQVSTGGLPISLDNQPEGYDEWLKDLKFRIHTARQRSALAVNRELVLLYWQIGREILTRQEKSGWGAKVIERLAHDLRNSFPEMKGFSRANLMYMRAFAEAWSEEQIVQQAVGQLPWGHNLALLGKLPAGDYSGLLSTIKSRIRTAQTRVVLAVNAELIRLYWEIGK